MTDIYAALLWTVGGLIVVAFLSGIFFLGWLVGHDEACRDANTVPELELHGGTD
jgi:hypothetical protein